MGQNQNIIGTQKFSSTYTLLAEGRRNKIDFAYQSWEFMGASPMIHVLPDPKMFIKTADLNNRLQLQGIYQCI